MLNTYLHFHLYAFLVQLTNILYISLDKMFPQYIFVLNKQTLRKDFTQDAKVPVSTGLFLSGDKGVIGVGSEYHLLICPTKTSTIHPKINL